MVMGRNTGGEAEGKRANMLAYGGIIRSFRSVVYLHDGESCAKPLT